MVPYAASELKIQLQSSFETEDGTLEEPPAGTDGGRHEEEEEEEEAAAVERRPSESVDKIPAPPRPADAILNSNCPLSDELRDLRLETRR